MDDEGFIRELTSGRQRSGMVMTHPPSVPSKTLDQVLSEQAQAPLPPLQTTEEGFSMIAIEHIRRSPYQVCAPSDDDYINALAESIRETKGVISPVVVRPIAGESLTVKLFEFIAGEHRALACQRLGYLTIPCVVRPLSDAQAAIALSADNAVKRTLGDYDRFQHVRMLRKHGFCRTDSEVASALGVSKALVSQLNAYAVLPQACHAILAQQASLLSVRYAYEIKDLAQQHPEVVTEAVQRLLEGKLKAAALKSWVTQRLVPAVGKPYRRELKISHPGRQDIRLVVSSGEAKIVAPGINPEKLAALLEANLPVLFEVEASLAGGANG